MVICDKYKKCGATHCSHKLPHKPVQKGLALRETVLKTFRVWESPVMPENELTCVNAVFFCYYYWDRVTCISIEENDCGVCEEL